MQIITKLMKAAEKFAIIPLSIRRRGAGKGGLVKIDKSVSVMYTQPAGAVPAKGTFCIGLGKLLWQNGPCAKYRPFSLRQSAEKLLFAKKDMGQMEKLFPKCLK